VTEPSDNQGANEQPQQQYQQPQGGWAQPGPGSTQPMYPEQTLPDGMYQPPQQAPQAQPGPYGAPQQPYYGAAPQNPYAVPADPYAQQQQAQYGYPQGQQPQPTYPYGQNAYDPNAGYGQPMQPQGSNAQGRNALVATCVAVGVLAVGVCVYWFGFHNSGGTPTPSRIALTTSQSPLVADSPSASAEPSDTAASTDEPDPLSTDGGDVSALQELMATMSDPGCRSAFQTLITFEQSTAQDSDDDLALLKDYNTAISSLKDARDQSEDSDASDAISQVITDWKAYTAQLASGGTPDDNTMEDDGAQLASACLAAG
jgi:hypothetical protein